ncbi:glutathione S-transferase [Coniophora puteana RWD-64-598 SS2]|uniref:glutathione transferase n=1 Tax=Coniophora puteana (strain RWD-64-598) TaxID=741705 RepID=A0A5M3MDQ7_CONPW|nr:glutathione S-transferase [Coniophora puteana RWD-64-598 SS2]EIW77399.1 glutathione S-transferase [Coniophora puteana RWD-64-598 SS2]
MVLKIHGASQSTCTRTVAVVATELNVPYELVPVNFATAEHKSPAFTAVQPFGQLPYIDDDGFKLYESRAIARYLVKKYGGQGTVSLIPTGLKEEALFEQGVSIETANFYPSAIGFGLEKVFKPMRGVTPDEARAAECLKTLEAKLDVYDVLLGKQKYVGGNEITLADIFHLPYGQLLVKVGRDDLFESRPNVARWWKEISTRPSWLAVKDGA